MPCRAGLLGNPNVRRACTQAQFDGDACPATSQVGTQTVNVTLLGLLPGQRRAARSSTSCRMPVSRRGSASSSTRPEARSQHLESHVRIRTESDDGLTSTIARHPEQRSRGCRSHQQHQPDAERRLERRASFMRTRPRATPPPRRCSAVGYSGTTADRRGQLHPHRLRRAAVRAEADARRSAAPATPRRRAHPSLTTVIEQAAGRGGTQERDRDPARAARRRTSACSRTCARCADYDADTCPDKSQVGTATAVTPLLATPLTGPVRLVDDAGQPAAARRLPERHHQPAADRPDVSARTRRTVNTFSTIPDVPLSRFQLNFTGGPGGLIGIARTSAAPRRRSTASSRRRAGRRRRSRRSPPSTAARPARSAAPVSVREPRAPVARRLRTQLADLLSLSARKGSTGKLLARSSCRCRAALSFDRAKLRAGQPRRSLAARSAAHSCGCGRSRRRARRDHGTGEGRRADGVAGPARACTQAPGVLVKLTVTEVHGSRRSRCASACGCADASRRSAGASAIARTACAVAAVRVSPVWKPIHSPFIITAAM